MILNFVQVIRDLGANAAFRFANAVKPTASYLFNTLLPEQNRPEKVAKGGNMIVRATMAQMVGMDSAFPPTGTAQATSWIEQLVKLGNQPYLPEAALEQLQEMVRTINGAATGRKVDLAVEALNFLDKIVVQPHIDTAEYLRGEALNYGALDWTSNNQRLQVTYGIPAANILTERTGTDRYGSTSSKFWEDMLQQGLLLNNNVRARIASSATINQILANQANGVQVVAQSGDNFQVRRLVVQGGNTIASSDARETITLTRYDKAGEIIDQSNPSGPGIRVPFQPDGRIVAVGFNENDGYRPGQGSTDDPALDQALGYTHLGPTVEGDGAPGRWARLFTPEQMPMQLHGQGASKVMPVLENPNKVVIARTAMA